jgi:cyclophilin family peptidyl-prolyl cis-trans isomerase/HEAT repeat protein
MNANSILLVTCLSAGAAGACSTPKTTHATQAAARTSEQTPEVQRERALDEIRKLEDARHPAVESFASHSDSEVRARAARALGRVLDAPVQPLLALLEDSNAAVRAEAAFALGLRAEKGACDALLAHADPHREPDALVRARAIEAASKLDTPDRREAVLAALADADPRVRLEAAQGASRWPTKEPGAANVDRALVALLERETDADVITYALFLLDRRKSGEAFQAFVRFAGSQDARQRIFAVRGLVALVDSRSLGMLDATTAIGVLLAHTDDPDWRVICEAVPVYKTSADEQHPPANPLSHHVANVRQATWRVIGEWISKTRDHMVLLGSAGWLLPEDSGALVDYEASPFVWAAGRETQLRIYARLLTDSEDLVPRSVPYESLLSTTPIDADNPIALAGIARGIEDAPDALFQRVVQPYLRHADVRVASAAIESLAKHLTPENRGTLHELLYGADNGLRLAALGSLDAKPDASDLEHVAWTFENSRGDIAPEVRFTALRLAAKIGGGNAIALLQKALSAPEPFVRAVARAELATLAPNELAAHDAAKPSDAPAAPHASSELPRYSHDPIVEVETNRGTLRFELFPDEAPYHVHNFLTLIERGYYDGLGFHRVVPDFVIQGGDYRGDGNGGTTFRVPENVRELHAKGEFVPQDSLRNEIGPRKYVRGSLGMPRNEDLDSGGSQFFVTHRETPHLDGRYTIFGELRSGFEVLDAIEVGDVIVHAKIVDAGR